MSLSLRNVFSGLNNKPRTTGLLHSHPLSSGNMTHDRKKWYVSRLSVHVCCQKHLVCKHDNDYRKIALKTVTRNSTFESEVSSGRGAWQILYILQVSKQRAGLSGNEIVKYYIFLRTMHLRVAYRNNPSSLNFGCCLILFSSLYKCRTNFIVSWRLPINIASRFFNT